MKPIRTFIHLLHRWSPTSPKELSFRAECAQHNLREWCSAQTAGNFVDHHAMGEACEALSNKAMLLVDEGIPSGFPFEIAVQASIWTNEKKGAHAFLSSEKEDWGDHVERMYGGTTASYRTAIGCLCHTTSSALCCAHANSEDGKSVRLAQADESHLALV